MKRRNRVVFVLGQCIIQITLIKSI
uniref:Uncharacterized protein n=1 Tax=Arundo donax TaxID=35708 RepID=A0A0A8ZSE1_ARUDO